MAVFFFWGGGLLIRLTYDYSKPFILFFLSIIFLGGIHFYVIRKLMLFYRLLKKEEISSTLLVFLVIRKVNIEIDFFN